MKKKIETSSLEEKLKFICQASVSEPIVKKENEVTVGGLVKRKTFNLVPGFSRHLFLPMSFADRVLNWAEILTIAIMSTWSSFRSIITVCASELLLILS